MNINDTLHATHDATILLRSRVSAGTVPSLGDCVLLNAALHLEGRTPSVRTHHDPVDWSRVCDDEECQRFPNRCDHVGLDD
jgi:hypothetical protein